jgi:hypothetical protein
MEKLRGLNTFLIHCLISSWLFPSSGISWIEFLNITDYVGDMLSHLREGDLKGAQHLWLRHEVTQISTINCCTIRHLKEFHIFLL